VVFKPVREGHRGDFTEIKLGDKVEVEHVSLRVGGSGINTAVTFARQGLSVGFAGTIGHDTAGQAVLELLDREGIGRRLVQYSRAHHTGYSTVLVAPGGERTILEHPGASAEFDDIDIDTLVKTKPSWVYVSTLHGNFIKLRQLFEACAQAGIKVAFNPGEAELKQPKKLRPLLEDVAILLVNQAEARQVVTGYTLDELVHHALNLVPSIAITAGASGAIVSDGQSVVRAGLYEDVRVVDKTGTGDAFGSGLLAALMSGSDLADAVRFASANATSVVSMIGSQSGILSTGIELGQMPIKETKLR
jgi:ribokinase